MPRSKRGTSEVSMNKRVYVGLFLPAIGLTPLLAACGGQEQPPPAEPSGYQPPTADAGTDQGIGNMSGDVNSTEPMSSPGSSGTETAPNAEMSGTATTPGDTGMGSGGTGGTASAGGTGGPGGGSGGTANMGMTTRTTGTTGHTGGVGTGTTGSMR